VPVVLVTVSKVVPVAVFLTTTAAPGMTPPLGSTTTPEIDDVAPPCAYASVERQFGRGVRRKIALRKQGFDDGVIRSAQSAFLNARGAPPPLAQPRAFALGCSRRRC
jgi:hypothetical protein